MQNKTSSRSGFFRPRVLVALSLCSLGVMLAMFSLATPTPTSGTLSTANRTVTYTESAGGVVPNPSEVALSMPNCTVPMSCSTFLLTIDPSVGTPATGYDPTQYQIFLEWQWAIPTVDYDIFVEDSTGTTVIASNRSTADPSSITLPSNTPPGVYRLVVALATGAPIAFTGTVTLQPKPAVSGLCNPNVADCTPPRYKSYPAAPGQADDAGEPSLGVDWNPNVAALQHDKVNTGGVSFFTSGPHEWRANFDDCSSPAVNLWEDVSATFTQQFVLSDPIGFVDHYTSNPLGLVYPPPKTPGRVFTIDLLGGQGDSAGSFSDTDGNSYLPGGTGGPGQGPDHETLGGGPYNPNSNPAPPPQPSPYPAVGTPNAIYYCSQNIVAEAQCSRSDNGGQTFGPGIAIFTPTQCTGGIHGHVKVAPDGTVYVPNSSCGTTGSDGVAVSTDNGLTWTENNVTGSTGSQDPSVGIGQNNVGKPAGNLAGTNTIYVGWVSGDGHAHVAHSGNRGATYAGDTDVGAPFGVTHAVFPVVVAGDDNRASFAFLGTGDGIATSGTCDPYGATLNCKNIWHLYIATTYDGGANWITIDATPDDPVQQGTICLQGTTCGGGRNLLDFNDFAIDSQGRGLVGYADGCVNCGNTFTGQSAAAHGTITRQSGGRRLFKAFDPNPVEPVPPAAPQLISAFRGSGGVLVTWLEPDNGGSPIIGYNVYRGASSGTEVFLAGVSGATDTKFLDTAAPAGNLFYYVQAVNAIGEGTHCREVSLSGGPGPETECAPPGLSKLSDPAGDTSAVLGLVSTPAPPGADLKSFQIAQPYQPDGVPRLVFTINTWDNGQSPQPPGSAWYVSMQVPVSARAPNGYVAVHMAWSGTTPTFESYTPGANGATPPGYDGRFVVAGSQKPAEATSNYITPFNQVVIVVKASDLGLNPGDTISGFVSAVSQTEPGPVGVITGLYDMMPDSLAYTGSYVVDNNQVCRPNIAPTAVLTATPMSGAPPLLVHFSGANSTDPDTDPPADTIASYTFDFGDGSAPVTQTTATIDHTYNAQGEFPARLTVTDSRGKVSTNPAQVVISVAVNRPPVADLKASPTSGNPPLDVTFDGSGSTDPDLQDVIVKWQFRFGDGTPDVTQGAPVIHHTYTSPGTYSARLVVTDSRGADSENNAEQDITVQSNASPTPTATATATPTATATATPTATATATASPTATATATASPTPTASATASPTPTATATATATASPSATATATATPTATATATATPTATATATPTATPNPTPTNVELVNIAGRVFAQTGDKVGIAGFIISGSGTKRIMARAIGPSLNVSGKLQDPYLEIHDSSGSPPLTNDNWRSTQEAEIQQTGLAPTNDKESAIVKRLPAGNYTAIIRGADNSPGIGVVEIYDLSTSDPGELGNLSVRADVQTGDNVLFDGLILQGGTPKRVLFRALGPSIKVNGQTIPGALQDPTLELHSGNGTLLGSNDDWHDAPNAADIQATGLAPPDNKESAILMTLVPGNYTTIVRGKNGTGIGLAEAYKLN